MQARCERHDDLEAPARTGRHQPEVEASILQFLEAAQCSAPGISGAYEVWTRAPWGWWVPCRGVVEFPLDTWPRTPRLARSPNPSRRRNEIGSSTQPRGSTGRTETPVRLEA